MPTDGPVWCLACGLDILGQMWFKVMASFTSPRLRACTSLRRVQTCIVILGAAADLVDLWEPGGVLRFKFVGQGKHDVTRVQTTGVVKVKISMLTHNMAKLAFLTDWPAFQYK